MPVRSLTSSVLRWPDRNQVDDAVRAWAEKQPTLHPGLIGLGYFGSYARGDWGVGSDLDLIAIVTDSDRPFLQRALDWDLADLPVPADILVYTAAEWEGLLAEGGRFGSVVEREAVWLQRSAVSPAPAPASPPSSERPSSRLGGGR